MVISCDVSIFLFFKQSTAYEMRISDWSSDVCSSDLIAALPVLLPQRHGFPSVIIVLGGKLVVEMLRLGRFITAKKEVLTPRPDVEDLVMWRVPARQFVADLVVNRSVSIY